MTVQQLLEQYQCLLSHERGGWFVPAMALCSEGEGGARSHDRGAERAPEGVHRTEAMPPPPPEGCTRPNGPCPSLSSRLPSSSSLSESHEMLTDQKWILETLSREVRRNAALFSGADDAPS